MPVGLELRKAEAGFLSDETHLKRDSKEKAINWIHV